MLRKKLTTVDLLELSNNVELMKTERLDMGDVKLEGEKLFIHLMLPYDFMPENKPALLLKHKDFEKFRFTFDEEDIINASKNLTNSTLYSNNYVLVGAEYQVFIRPGVVIYLNEKEVGELVAIFKRIQVYLPSNQKTAANI